MPIASVFELSRRFCLSKFVRRKRRRRPPRPPASEAPRRVRPSFLPSFLSATVTANFARPSSAATAAVTHPEVKSCWTLSSRSRRLSNISTAETARAASLRQEEARDTGAGTAGKGRSVQPTTTAASRWLNALRLSIKAPLRPLPPRGQRHTHQRNAADRHYFRP